MNTQTAYKYGNTLYASKFLAKYAQKKNYLYLNETMEANVVTKITQNCGDGRKLILTSDSITIKIEPDSQTFLDKKLVRTFERLGFSWEYHNGHVLTNKKKPSHIRILTAKYIIRNWYQHLIKHPTTKTELKTIHMYNDQAYESKDLIDAYLALGGNASASTQLKCDKLITSFPDPNGGYIIVLYADGRIERCYQIVRFYFETNYHFTNDNLSQDNWYFRNGALHEIIPEQGKDAYIKLVIDEHKKVKY